MKETRFFYTPDIKHDARLPEDEAGHAVRVLRMQPGDEAWAMDGCGTFYRCTIAQADKRCCMLDIDEVLPQKRAWRGILTLAVAPTKNMDRLEWMTEKAVEIGVDRIVLLECKNSERTTVKAERLERIVISAMKQSRKPWKTEIVPMTNASHFIRNIVGPGFIAHCHEDMPHERPFLLDVLPTDGDMTVMVGPEGDFSAEEVNLAIENGLTPVSLGNSRLRTETAGIAAVHIMQIKASINV